MDLGMSGYQMFGGIATGYVADAPTNQQVQVEETSDTIVLQVVVPFYCEIISFGVIMTEDMDAHATDPVVSLKTQLVIGGTETVVKALTLGSGNTKLSKGDDSFDNVTAIAADTDLDNGDVVFADLSGTPSKKLVPGQVILVEHTTAAGEAGGSYVPFVLVKVSGPDFKYSNVWREVRSTETAGSE